MPLRSATCRCCLSALSTPFSFSSVEDFLRKARDAKLNQRPEVEEHFRACLDDPYAVGVPPELADQILALMEKYGDEPLRQIGMYCLGKWFEVHAGVAEDLVQTEQIPGALSASMDAARIGDAMALVQTIGSFGGDEGWKKMLHESLVTAVNDAMNQHGDQ